MSKILKNTFLYTLGNIIPQAAGFFLLPVYTTYLAPAEYGIVQSMQVLTSILLIIFTFAIDKGVYRMYFDFDNTQSRQTYLSTIVISIVAISLILLAIAFLLKDYVGKIFSSIDFHPYYVYAILTAYFTIYSIIPKIYYQINEQANRFVTISLLQFILNTSFVLWFVIVKEEKAAGMLKGLLYSSLLTLPALIYVISKIINFTFNSEYLKKSLAFSLPMIPSLISAWILNLSDRIFIENYFSMSEVGIYSLGYKIAGLILVISSAFNLAYNPVFYKLANSNDQKSAKKKLTAYAKLYMLALFAGIFSISFLSKEVILLFFNQQYSQSYIIIYLISIAYLFSQLSSLGNLAIYQVKKTYIVMSIIIFCSLLNLLLNYILIPQSGMLGAAYATIIAFITNYILVTIFAKKYYYIPTDWFLFLGLLVISVSIIYGTSLISLNPIITLAIKSIFLLCLFGSLLYWAIPKYRQLKSE